MADGNEMELVATDPGLIHSISLDIPFILHDSSDAFLFGITEVLAQYCFHNVLCHLEKSEKRA